MRLQQVLLITLLSFLGLSAIAQVASAAAAKESTNDDVLITGYTPGQKVEVQYSSISKEKGFTQPVLLINSKILQIWKRFTHSSIKGTGGATI